MSLRLSVSVPFLMVSITEGSEDKLCNRCKWLLGVETGEHRSTWILLSASRLHLCFFFRLHLASVTELRLQTT